MAIISKDKLFEKLAGSFWNAGVTFERTNPVPLEKYSLFKTLAEAETYATTSPVAYPGQPIAVVGDDSTTLYFIDNDGTLKPIASGSSTEGALDEAKKYTNTVSAALSTDYTGKIKAVDDKLSGYVLTANAEDATADDKLLKASSVSAVAQAYVNALDVAAKPVTASQTVKSISQTDGKISVELQDIAIEKSAVNGLTADLTKIEKLANDVSATAAATFLSASTFTQISNDIGLSAASAENKVVTKNDIASLNGAMHFIGAATLSSDDEDPISCLNRTFTGDNAPKAGDVAIITNTAKEFVYVSGDGITAGWLELGDESQHATKSELSTAKQELSTYVDTKFTAAHNELTAVSADINNALTAETKARTDADTKFTADIKVLSGAIDNKISVGDYANGATAWRDNSNLSVIKIGADDYHALVAAGSIDENTVYIVSSDYLNAYDQRVQNVATPEDDKDAANKKYVDDAVTTATTTIKSTSLSGVSVNGVTATVTDNVASIQIDLIDCGNASTADLII